MMKIFVKTLKGSQFDVQVKPEDSVADVKKHIENARGADVYPAAQQMLIHQGQVLKDDTTLDENNVVESSFVVIMLKKSKSSSGEGSGAPTATSTEAPQTSVISAAPTGTSMPRQVTRVILPPPGTNARAVVIPHSESDPHAQVASDLVAGTNLEGTIQQILEMGGGTWDRDTVVRALRAAFNNPERAIDYLYSGIPEEHEAPPAARIPVSGGDANFPAQPAQSVQPVSNNPPSGPYANPLNLFPRGLPNLGAAPAAGTAGAGNLNVLRDNPWFQKLRTIVQSNPQILQPIIQELGKQNPNLRNLIQQHQADLIRLINEPVEGVDGVGGEERNLLEELAAAMPQSVTVTPEEHEAIERLEAMGFERHHVLEVFIACNKNEELAANFLLDHMHED